MNNENVRSNFAGTATVILLSFLLFYFPSMLAIFSHGDEPRSWIVMSVVMSTIYTAIFCINYFWIVPYSLFNADRKFLFFIINFSLIILLCSFIPIWFETHGGLPGPRHHSSKDLTIAQYLMGYFRFVIRDGVMMVLSVALAYALRLSQEREQMRRRQLELNAEQRQLELKSLKAQLNPHFLFNSLNNIYALISISPDRAQKALHDLSGMLRFMIYDAATPFVPVVKEMQFISDYVELMKLRLGSNVRLDVNIDKRGTDGLYVAPLLFLTLVENAFKHGGSNGNDNYISIDFQSVGNEVRCRVENTCPDTNTDNKDLESGKSGVGLANIERQLRLLYPGEHVMKTERNPGIYTAEIIIRAEALLQHIINNDQYVKP